MKKFLIAALICLGSLPAYSSQYKCTFSNGLGNDSDKIIFSFDTSTQENKFVKIDQSMEVGCLVFRASKELLTCGIGGSDKFSISATTENGSSVLDLNARGGEEQFNLRCVTQQ